MTHDAYFQFRMTPEFKQRVWDMVELGHARNFSDALRTFVELGMEIAKKPQKQKKLMNRIEESLGGKTELNDAEFVEIIKNIQNSDAMMDIVLKLDSRHLATFTEACCRAMACDIHFSKILYLLNEIIDTIHEMRIRDELPKEQVKTDCDYSFDALEELDSSIE